jgi:shikimate dehydrogenase
MRRYLVLLQEILRIDVVYMPIGEHDGGKIDPERFAWALRGLNSIGGAISKDIKGAIVPYLDVVDELARAVGAVNTVIRRGPRLLGYNTDAMGFEQAITAGILDLPIRAAVCYGYGGVTSVVVAVLHRMGIEVYITGRSRDSAARRAAELGARLYDSDSASCCAQFLGAGALFVNAAPVTDRPLEEAPNFLQALAACTVAFDHEMPGAALREHCRAHGIKHIAGESMYSPFRARGAHVATFLGEGLGRSVYSAQLLSESCVSLLALP